MERIKNFFIKARIIIDSLHLYDNTNITAIRSVIWLFTALLSIRPKLSIQSIVVFYTALFFDVFDKRNDDNQLIYVKVWFGLISFACLTMIAASLLNVFGLLEISEDVFIKITKATCWYIGIDAALKMVIPKEVKKEDINDKRVDKCLEKMNTGNLGDLKDGEQNE